MSLLNSLESKGKRGRAPKKPWTLKEVLAVMYMLEQEDMSKADVAEIIGRTEHQIQYHILENPINEGGKKKRRSLKAKYIVDAASEDEGYKNLFAHFNVEYKGKDQIAELILEYQEDLKQAMLAQATGA